MEILKKRNLIDYSGLELAYIGDAVWELELRKYYLQFGYNILKLNKYVKAKVNAKAQSKLYKKIFSELEESYQIIGKRAKNSNIKTFPRSCTVMEYKEATALEAIIGAMYIKEDLTKIKKIIIKFIEGDENGDI
ncbi:MAG: Mini-ribonuclease 3-like protein [Fusobacteriales bacterium]|nr:MAG: Mini-ribonuclease 3-like protein [Fusobacteriales bacterium]